MSAGPNPYEAPIETEGSVQEAITFGDAMKRGFAAAHGAPTGAVWFFVLMAPIQILTTVVGTIMLGSDFFEQLQSGEVGAEGRQPPPELFMLAGVGCAICLWLPVFFFGLPWVWGGTVGQIRDRILRKEPMPFTAHGKRHYGSMILLFLLLIAAVIIISIPNAIVGQVVAATQISPGEPMSAEQMRALSRHPLNVLSSILTTLVMTGVGIIINLVAYAIVASGRGIVDGLRHGFSFTAAHSLEVFKLYLVCVVLIVPLALVQWLAQLLPPSLALSVVIGLVVSLYIAYLGIVNFGLAGSLFEARMKFGPDAEHLVPSTH